MTHNGSPCHGLPGLLFFSAARLTSLRLAWLRSTLSFIPTECPDADPDSFSNQVRAATHFSLMVFMLITAALSLSLALGVLPTKAASVWYVAPGGNDSHTCQNPASPCVTINGALSKPGFAAGDTILVGSGIYTGTGSEVVLLIKSAALSGGWSSEFTAQSGTSTIDGESARRGITVNSGVTAIVERFTIQSGSASSGGGIHNSGTLTLNDSLVTGNTATDTFGGGGGILNGWPNVLILNSSTVSGNTASGSGGGITNHGTLTMTNGIVTGNNAVYGGGIGGDHCERMILNNSVVRGNTSSQGGGIDTRFCSFTAGNSNISANIAGGGGGIYGVGSTLTLNNSTVSGNMASWGGGGIFNRYYGNLTINNGTVSSNKTDAFSGGGIADDYDSTVTLRNTVLAGNTASSGPDCTGAIGTAGHNLIGKTSGCTFTPSTGDLTNVNARLGQLISAPGIPGYHPLLAGSPAIDAGNPAGCVGSTGPLTTDQRGAARVGRCDIGAYEYSIPDSAASIHAYAGTPQHAIPGGVFGTPLQALVLDSIGSPVHAATVTFSAPVIGASGTFSDTGTFTTTARTSESGIATATTFTANGMEGNYTVTATVSGVVTPASLLLGNIFWYVSNNGNDGNDCQSPATACATINGVLSKLSFIAGDTIRAATGTYTGTGEQVVELKKGAILSGGWNPDFSAQTGMSTIDGQNSRQGLVLTYGNEATVERFTIQNGYDPGSDMYGGGGGIFNDGHLTLKNCNVKENDADVGGGIYNGRNTLIVYNSSISGNHARSGMYGGGGILNSGSLLILNNSTVAGNTTSGSGGAIFSNQGTLELNNSSIGTNSALNNGGGIYNEDSSSQTKVHNSILAQNTAGSGPDCTGTLISLGHNLLDRSAGCNFISAGGDITNTGAFLGPAEGESAYLPLLPGSQAINNAHPAGCTDHLGSPLVTDQRGFPRFGRCDIGAYELQPIGFSTKTAHQPDVFPGSAVTYTIALTNGGVINLANVRVTDTLPVSLTYIANSLVATGGSYGYHIGVITWTGSVNAGRAVTITFATTVTRRLGFVANSAVISGGGEFITRSVGIEIIPHIVYLPCLARNYCPLLYADDFSDPGSGWPVADEGNARYEYLMGEYRILVRNTDLSVGARPDFKASDYIVAVDARNATGVYGTYGLMFGLSDDWTQFYTFEIDPDRDYVIWRYTSGLGWTPIAYGSSAFIYPGTATNRLKIERDGALIKAYANGQLLTSISDSSYTGLRHVGLIVSAYDHPNVDIRFDNFKVYPVSCGAGATRLLETGGVEATGDARPGTWLSRSNGRER